jgi:hypothetical protein
MSSELGSSNRNFFDSMHLFSFFWAGDGGGLEEQGELMPFPVYDFRVSRANMAGKRQKSS